MPAHGNQTPFCDALAYVPSEIPWIPAILLASACGGERK